MKHILIIIGVVLASLNSLAQAPEKFSYQAVLRDNNSNLVVNQTVGMRIGIYQGSISGTKVYEETHLPTSNSNGLVSLQIGTGTAVIGSISSIDWSNGPYFIKREIDLSGGASYSITGSSELVSVPYALYSKKVENFVNGDVKLNYSLNTTSSEVTILTTNQSWAGNRRILLSGYVTMEFDFPPASPTTTLTTGNADVDLSLKYDGQTIMPINFKNIKIEDNGHVVLPITALIPNSTPGNSKQFSVTSPSNSSETGLYIPSSGPVTGPFLIPVKLNIVLSWVEL